MQGTAMVPSSDYVRSGTPLSPGDCSFETLENPGAMYLDRERLWLLGFHTQLTSTRSQRAVCFEPRKHLRLYINARGTAVVKLGWSVWGD